MQMDGHIKFSKEKELELVEWDTWKVFHASSKIKLKGWQNDILVNVYEIIITWINHPSFENEDDE